MTPGLYRLVAELLAAALALVGAFALGHHGGVTAGRADVERKWNAERAQVFQQAASATQAARDVEQRRTAAAQEIAHEAENAASAARSDAVAAAAAADRLRARAAQLAARCSAPAGDPAAAGGGSAATSPGLVLADVLSRVEEAGRRMAEEADRRAVAGRACEASYDALAPEPRRP